MEWTLDPLELGKAALFAVLSWLGDHGLRLLLIAVAAFVAFRVVRTLVARLREFLLEKTTSTERRKRVDTLSGLMQNIAGIILSLLILMVVLQEIGVPVGPLLAAAGIGGLAFGFGAQSLVKDVISGFFFLIEDNVRVGDVVNLAGIGGLVERVGLRTVVLRDLAGNVHVIPHGAVSTLTNMTKDYSRYVFNVGVAYREDPDEVMAVLREIGDGIQNDPAFREDILEPLEILGVDELGDSAVVIKCRITTRPIQQWRVGREMNRRIKKTFDERGIEIPFPHRTVYWGESKRGTAPALRVRKMREPSNGEPGPKRGEGGGADRI